jgi:hypothetical protein
MALVPEDLIVTPEEEDKQVVEMEHPPHYLSVMLASGPPNKV